MPAHPALAASPLFAGLDDSELQEVEALMRPRKFEADERVCEGGTPSDSIFLITSGLVHWFAPTTEGAGELLLRLRKGDVIGAQDSITGSPRLATVVASIATSALEMATEDLVEVARRHPQILLNLVGIQRERMFRANARIAEKERGEEIALIAGPSVKRAVSRIAAAARGASPRPVMFVDRDLSFAGAITAADDLAAKNATVLIPGDLDPANVERLLDEVDRVVALAGTAEEVAELGKLTAAAEGHKLEVVLIGDEAVEASRGWPGDSKVVVLRACPGQPDFPLADEDVSWLARHLTRTKLGVALGAGGAKGYAHVGVLQVLEEAGYTIDNIGGSSIGGFVSSQFALGYSADEINQRFREAFNPENVQALFSSPFGGGGAGLEVLTNLLKQATDEKSFSDAVMPLVIMAVDLTDRAPAPMRDGPLWEALLAALAVAGVFPPQERDGHRLVDGLALVPVPTASVVEDGADIVVSVNLMGAETLESWPGGPAPEAEPEKKKKKGVLDTLLEVMDLSQLDTSARHAALADVVVTPRFAQADWRDFDIPDRFLEAGRAAALEQLPQLRSLSAPVDLEAVRREASLV